MTDSLNLAGFELIGGATAFRLGEGWDLGTGEPDTSSIASLLLDGEVIVGDRTHNRTITLPLETLGRSITSRDDITQQVNALAQAVNVRTGQSFPLLWTPSGGRTIQFDCYRATVIRTRTLRRDNQLVGQVTVTFQAAPFGKSTAPQTISAALAQVQLDSYATAPTGATLDTSIKYEGTGSAKGTLTRLASPVGGYYYSATTISRTFGVQQNLLGNTAITVRVRWPQPDTAVGHMLNLSLTLTSNVYGSYSEPASATYTIGDTAWRLFTIPLGGPFDNIFSHVDSYKLDFTSDVFSITTPPTTSSFWVDDLRALPPSSAGISTAHGTVLTIPGIQGSARAPVTLTAVKSGGGTLSSLLLHSPPADQDPDVAILQGLDSSLADQTLTVAAANAAFDGTYGVWLAVASTSGSAAQTVAITVTQLENGTAVGSVTTVTTTYTAPDADKLVYVGNVTLPLYAVPADNTTTSYTIRVNRTAGVDLYSDIVFCDTRGQTIQVTPPAAAAAIYVEEPDPVTGFGQVLTTGSNRTAAYSTLGSALVTGGPIQFDPGSNRLVALSPDGPPSVTATLYPRWLDERAS